MHDLFFPISPSSLFGIMSICLSGKHLWFLKLCLGTWAHTFSVAAVIALLGLCLWLAAPRHHSHSLQYSLTSPVFGPSSLLSLYNSLMNPRHVQQTSYLQNCLLFRWFVFLSTVMQLFQYRFAKKWKHGVVTFFRSSKVVPICVLDGREYLFPTALALQSHICFGWKLTTSLVFSMSPPPPFTQHPQHARFQARGLTLTDNGCVQLQGISNRVLSQKLSVGLSGPWWMAPSSVSLPINNPLAPRWARCPSLSGPPFHSYISLS